MPGPVSILAAIPWGLLIEKAPTILDGGQKLLDAMRSSQRQEVLARADVLADTRGAPSLEAHAEAIRALEASVELLDRDLKSSASLIADLSEANAGLVRQIRFMKNWLVATTFVAAAASVGCVWLSTLS